MTNLQMWSLLCGAALPWVLAFLQNHNWDSTIKGVLSLVACGVVALGTTYFTGSLDLQDWVGSVLLVAVTAYGLRKGLYQTALNIDGFEKAANIPGTQ